MNTRNALMSSTKLYDREGSAGGVAPEGPVPAPSPASPAPPAEPIAFEPKELTENDFASLINEIPGDDDVDVEVPAGNTAPAPAPQGATPAPAPAAVVAPAPGVQTPATPAAAAPAVVPAPVAAPAPAQPVDMQAMIREHRGIAEAALATQYALTPEQMTELDTQPEVAIPKMFARLHLEVMTGVLQQMQTNLPSMIGRLQESQTAATKNEGEFFDAWPQLKGHDAKVKEIGVMYRQMNPQASKADFVQNVGAMAVVALKLSGGAVAAPAPQAAARPFVPAGGGGTTPPVVRSGAAADVNPFTAFVEEMDRDER